MYKIIPFICLLLALGNSAVAQEKLSYSILSDDPDAVPNNYVYLYYFDYTGAMLAQVDERNNAAAYLGSSLAFWHGIRGPIGVDGSLRISYFGEGTEVKSLPISLNLGAHFGFASKRKTKDVKINVRAFRTKVDVETDDGQYLGQVDAIGMDQITVPGTYELTNSLHAGLHYENGTYDRQREGLGTYNAAAVYVGFVRESKVAVNVRLGEKRSFSSQYLRYYADVLVYPVLNSNLPSMGNVNRIGARFGALGSFPNMRNFMNAMTPKVEVGLHGINGSYFTIGFGVNVYKS